MGTMTLYSVSTSQPLPPVIGQRVGNMFEGVWGINDSRTIDIGSTTTTFSKRTITSFDLIATQSSLESVMSLEPTGIIPSGTGAGKDFNILSANKKYTIGCGFLQNRDNTFYLGCANGSSSGRYIATTPVSKNTFRYYVYKVIPTGQAEIYQNECGIYNQSFSKTSSFVALTDTDITRVRMLLGYSAAEGTERWQQTLGMFFRPFCFEGETWFPFINQPWKTGTSLFSCTVSYDDATKTITSVGTIENLGFSINGVSLDNLCEPSKSVFGKASFPGYYPLNEKYASFPSGYNYGQYAFSTGYFNYNGSAITPPSKKGYRPETTLRYDAGVGTFYLYRYNDTSIRCRNESNGVDTIYNFEYAPHIAFILISAGGSSGSGGSGSNNGHGGSGGGACLAWVKIPTTTSYSSGVKIQVGAGGPADGGGSGENVQAGNPGGRSYIVAGSQTITLIGGGEGSRTDYAGSCSPSSLYVPDVVEILAQRSGGNGTVGLGGGGSSVGDSVAAYSRYVSPEQTLGWGAYSGGSRNNGGGGGASIFGNGGKGDASGGGPDATSGGTSAGGGGGSYAIFNGNRGESGGNGRALIYF